MSWRYQPVWIMSHDEKLHILIEVFFDNGGTMEAWSLYEENRRYEPMGETQEELIEDLEIKLKDAKKWKAVEYEKMEVGMKFEKRNQAMTEEEILAAAKDDPDAQPLTPEELKQMKPVSKEKRERLKRGLTEEDIEIINFVTENNQLLKNLKQKDDEGKT